MNKFNHIRLLGGSRKYIYSDDMSGCFPGNPSITNHRDSIYINMRGLDYCYPGDFSTINQAISHNWIGQLKNDLNTFNMHEIFHKFGPYKYCDKYIGIEDIRLISWNDTLYGLGGCTDIREDSVVQTLIQFNDDIVPTTEYYIYNNQSVEKNWMPIESMPFCFLYKVDNTHIVKLNTDNNTLETIYEKDLGIVGSGSSQVIDINDHHICIVHRHEPWPNYEHSFVIYNKDFTEAIQTEWFKFSDYPIEFVTGMCCIDNTILISMSEYDCIPLIISVPANKLLGEYIKDIPDPTGIIQLDKWQPDYIGDIYQNCSYQLYKNNWNAAYNSLIQLTPNANIVLQKFNNI